MGFPVAINNVTTTLAAVHTAGGSTLQLAPGGGALVAAALAELGAAVSPATPLRVTVFPVATVNALGQITDRSALSIFAATGLAGDTLSGVAPVEGRTDPGFLAGDLVGFNLTAGMVAQLGGTVTADRLEASGVTPGSYQLATLGIDAKGRITSAAPPTLNGLIVGDGLGGIGQLPLSTYLTPTGNGSGLTGLVAAQIGAVPDGMLKGFHGAFTSAVADTDFIAPGSALLAAKAPLASPALTGVPTAPTATAGTNTTQLATCAFVLANLPSGAVSGTGTSGTLAKWTGTSAIGNATAGTDFVAPGGVAGGQTIRGDTASGGNLTLLSTSHATLGKTYLNGVNSAYVDSVGALVFVATSDTSIPVGVAFIKNYASGNLFAGCASGLHCYFNAGTPTVIDITNTGSTGKIGFLGATPVARPTVSGSRATDTWRTSLMSALATLGLVTDSSTA